MQTDDKNLVYRNILFHALDSGFFLMGMVFFHQITIMVAFVKHIYDSPIIIGLIPTFLLIGFNLPAIITTKLVQRYPIRKKFITVFGFLQRLSILFMALSTFLLSILGSYITIILVLLFYFGFSFCAGIGGSAWLDFNTKTIPVYYRARTHAFRTFLGGIGGILLPILINHILIQFPFPDSYRLCFLCGFLLLMVSYFSFLMIKETDKSPVISNGTFKQYFQSLIHILRENRNFRKFIIAQILLSVSECGPAFFTSYAIDLLKINDSTVVLYTLLLNLSIAISGLLLGFIGDKAGNLKVLQIGAILIFIALCLIAFWPTHFVFYIVFVITGMTFNARLNGFQVFITEFGDAEDRIRYMALSSAIAGTCFGIMPLLGGILLSLKLISYTLLFGVGAIFSLAAFLCYTFVIKDPRFLNGAKKDITLN